MPACTSQAMLINRDGLLSVNQPPRERFLGCAHAGSSGPSAAEAPPPGERRALGARAHAQPPGGTKPEASRHGSTRSAPSNERWWLGLLVPLCLAPVSGVLVLDALQQQRSAPGGAPSSDGERHPTELLAGMCRLLRDQLWLMTPQQLVDLHRDGRLRPRTIWSSRRWRP